MPLHTVLARKYCTSNNSFLRKYLSTKMDKLEYKIKFAFLKFWFTRLLYSTILLLSTFDLPAPVLGCWMSSQKRWPVPSEVWSLKLVMAWGIVTASGVTANGRRTSQLHSGLANNVTAPQRTGEQRWWWQAPADRWDLFKLKTPFKVAPQKYQNVYTKLSTKILLSISALHTLTVLKINLY